MRCLGPMMFAWSTHDITTTGAIGDPRPATRERGDDIVELTVDKIAQALEEICRFEMPVPAGSLRGDNAMTHLLTTVVGSYPQPDWLIDRAALASRLPPRVRARELWRIDDRAPGGGAG